MCILFIYRNPEASVDSYRLIIAANRDEFFVRPAKPAHYWEKYPHCLGGIISYSFMWFKTLFSNIKIYYYYIIVDTIFLFV